MLLTPSAFIFNIFWKTWWGCALVLVKIIFVELFMDHNVKQQKTVKLLGRQWLKVYTEKDEITQMIALFLFTSHNNENLGNNEQFWATSNEHASDQPATDM